MQFGKLHPFTAKVQHTSYLSLACLQMPLAACWHAQFGGSRRACCTGSPVES